VELDLVSDLESDLEWDFVLVQALGLALVLVSALELDLVSDLESDLEWDLVLVQASGLALVLVLDLMSGVPRMVLGIRLGIVWESMWVVD
jgi:hypothetical protein